MMHHLQAHCFLFVTYAITEFYQLSDLVQEHFDKFHYYKLCIMMVVVVMMAVVLVMMMTAINNNIAFIYDINSLVTNIYI
jgi:hypothetical protein